MKSIKVLSMASPLILAIFTVITLYYSNSERLNPGQILIPMIFALIFSGILLLLGWLNGFTKNTGGFLICVFTGVLLLWYTIPVYLSIIALLVSLGLNKKGIPRYQYTGILSVVLIPAIIISGLLGIFNYDGNTNAVIGDYTYQPGQSNIYFIVPDRLPSPESMIETGINPNPLVNDLESKGFYVPPDNITHDPYTMDYDGDVYTTRTMRFFASVLNGGLNIPVDIKYKDCRELMNNSEIFDSLHHQGYQITNIATWFAETNSLPKSDYTLNYSDVSLLEKLFRDELSKAYWGRTILNGLNFRVLESDNSIHSVELGRHNWQYQQIIDIAQSGKTSQFIMAHIMLPHEPFIYTSSDDNMQQFTDQIIYAMSYIKNLAYQIRENDPEAIIIIQADEGMAFGESKGDNEDLSLQQWNGVFTAWHLPVIPAEIWHTEILGYLLGNV